MIVTMTEKFVCGRVYSGFGFYWRYRFNVLLHVEKVHLTILGPNFTMLIISALLDAGYHDTHRAGHKKIAYGSTWVPVWT